MPFSPGSRPFSPGTVGCCDWGGWVRGGERERGREETREGERKRESGGRGGESESESAARSTETKKMGVTTDFDRALDVSGTSLRLSLSFVTWSVSILSPCDRKRRRKALGRRRRGERTARKKATRWILRAREQKNFLSSRLFSRPSVRTKPTYLFGRRGLLLDLAREGDVAVSVW